MLDKEKLIHIKHTDIDFNKWDSCVNKSPNAIIYAFSWYLDIVSPNWEALVYGDYEAIMPLTQNKKYGIPCLFRPLFTQQLGILSSNIIDEMLIELFLEYIPKKYKLIDINLNKYNKVANTNKFKINNRATYELDLIQDYSSIYLKYHKNHKINIQKAKQNELSIIKGLMPNEVFKLIESSVKNPYIKTRNINVLRQLIAAGIRKNVGHLYGVYNKYNTLVCAGFFVKTRNKIYFILSISSEEGKKLGAMFLLMDNFIKDFSGKNITIEFKGSNIKSVEQFYSGYGAKKFTYNNLRINHLPFPFKLFLKT